MAVEEPVPFCENCGVSSDRLKYIIMNVERGGENYPVAICQRCVLDFHEAMFRLPKINREKLQ